MGGMKYRELAKASLDERKGLEMLSRQQAANARQQDEIQALQNTVEALRQTMQAMQANDRQASMTADEVDTAARGGAKVQKGAGVGMSARQKKALAARKQAPAAAAA